MLPDTQTQPQQQQVALLAASIVHPEQQSS